LARYVSLNRTRGGKQVSLERRPDPEPRQSLSGRMTQPDSMSVVNYSTCTSVQDKARTCGQRTEVHDPAAYPRPTGGVQAARARGALFLDDAGLSRRPEDILDGGHVLLGSHFYTAPGYIRGSLKRTLL
jgi:hypothetical protein